MRLTPPDFNALNEEQRHVYDSVAQGPRGGVRGPLALWLHRPQFAGYAQALGAYCRYDTALEPRLSELAILVTARAWSSEYEWFAHKTIAVAAGLSPDIVEAIRRGANPSFERDDEAVVHDFSRELHAQRKVSEATYSRAVQILGSHRVVDLVGLLGYYTLISMTINVFEIPLPEGETLQLGAAPGEEEANG